MKHYLSALFFLSFASVLHAAEEDEAKSPAVAPSYKVAVTSDSSAEEEGTLSSQLSASSIAVSEGDEGAQFEEPFKETQGGDESGLVKEGLNQLINRVLSSVHPSTRSYREEDEVIKRVLGDFDEADRALQEFLKTVS